ncbi:hypothetical protein ACFX15_041311 [Malus domestica]
MKLEELEKSFKELKVINRKQEKRAHYHETRAHNLAIGYLLLHALFFLGFSSRQPPNGLDSGYGCQWWVPFSMILVSSVTFFMAFLYAVTMFYRIEYHLGVSYLEQDLIYKKIQEAKQPPPESHVSIQLKECHTSGEVIKVDVFKLLKLKVYIYFTTLSLFALTILQLYVCRSASLIAVGDEDKDVEEKEKE